MPSGFTNYQGTGIYLQDHLYVTLKQHIKQHKSRSRVQKVSILAARVKFPKKAHLALALYALQTAL